MRIAICDDQPEYLKQTETAVRQCLRGMDYGVDTYTDGLSFLQAFKNRPCDLVFLDIEMPQIDGITLAKQLRQINRQVPIVFLTSHIEYDLEGYEVNALRYLTKPVNPQKLQEVLSYVLQQMQQERSIWVKTELCEKKLLVRDIAYLEAQNQNILVYTNQGAYCVRYNLSDYESELAEDGFFRIHRGYLVSLRHIKSIGKGEVLLTDSTSLPVSRSKEKALKEALFQYIQKESF